MFEHLKRIGITQPERIDRYTCRTEQEGYCLKIYFKRARGELFAKSAKFKYPIGVEGKHAPGQELEQILAELEQIAPSGGMAKTDLLRKIQEDLGHLERVVGYKLREIEESLQELAKLWKK